MELCGILPTHINLDTTNLPEEWDRVQTHMELIFSGPLKKSPLWVGETGRKIYKTWTLTNEESKKNGRHIMTNSRNMCSPN
jgi:hypothetical protein